VNSARPRGGVLPHNLTIEEEEEFYFRDTNHNMAVAVSVEHFQKDVICSLCGLWKSEHSWEICKEPNWL